MMKILLSLLVLCCVAGVLAEQVQVAKNVSITCGAEQCIALVDGSPTFFAPVNTSINLTVPFSFEPNTTVVQNVSIVQNVTNVTVVTQEVVVQNCSAAAVDVAAVSRELAGPLEATVRTAMSPSQTERDQWNKNVQDARDAEKQCRVDFAVVQAQFNAQKNITDAQFNALNATMTAQLEEAERAITPWQLVAVMAILAAAILGGIVGYKYYYVPVHQGPSAAEPLPELPEARQ